MSNRVSSVEELFPIGSRVQYRDKVCDEWRECQGTVVKHYRGGERCFDQETRKRYTTPDHVAVQVDKPLPRWWAYPDTDRFAPEAALLKVLP